MSDRTTFEARCPCGGSVKFEGGSNGAARVRDGWHKAHEGCAERFSSAPIAPIPWAPQSGGTKLDGEAHPWRIVNGSGSSVEFGPGCNS